MEVFIFGKLGEGKTSAARKLINDYLAANGLDSTAVYTPSEEDFEETHTPLFEIMRKENPRVIVFDSGIFNAEQLRKAHVAVEVYRSYLKEPKKGEAAVMAVYVMQGESNNFITYAYGNN